VAERVEQQRKSNVGGVTGKGFLPGQSGNPGGRAKGPTFRSWLRRKLAEPHPDDPAKTRYERWADDIIREAEKGERDKMEVIAFIEGKNPVDGGVEAAPNRPTLANGQPANP
jgi:hypothetical protein